jgi:hypothetical protein
VTKTRSPTRDCGRTELGDELVCTGRVRTRRYLSFAAAACVVAACSSAPRDSTPSTTTIDLATTTTSNAVATTAPASPTTTLAPSLGGYSVTPIRSDGQRVTFRLTVPDGAVAEVAFSPPDASIRLIEPSIGLRPPDGRTAGGGIFAASATTGVFADMCATMLGGNCTPKTSDALADGARVEEFTRVDGGVLVRVVFGPWAILVREREIASAFNFHGGPDGFPIVTARTPGYSTADPYLYIFMNDGRRFILRSDVSGACAATSAPRCDRGLSIDALGSATDDVTLRRIS